MRALRFLILLPIAFAFAITGAGLFLLIAGIAEPAGQRLVFGLADAVLDMVDHAFVYDVMPDFPMPLVWGLWRASLAILVAPVACVGLSGEAFRVSSFVYYAGLTGLVTALMPWAARARLDLAAGVDSGKLRVSALLFLTGCVAGAIYWVVAGRSAGPEPASPRPPAVTG